MTFRPQSNHVKRYASIALRGFRSALNRCVIMIGLWLGANFLEADGEEAIPAKPSPAHAFNR